MEAIRIIRLYLLTLIFLLASLFAKAQLSAADSVWFLQIFTTPTYATNVVAQDNFYVHDNINSTADLNNLLASVFKFSLSDFKNISSMVLDSTLYYDTDRNTTFNNYPLTFHQKDPLTYIKFELNGKGGTAFNYLFPRTSAGGAGCDRAFLVVPGNGSNSATELVQGYGQYNELCYVTNNLREAGDVYAMMKPNEDARALHWNHVKLDHPAMITMLESQSHRYGLNYLIEMIATIRLLKQKYSQVVLLGAAEGGYASVLASMVAHPDATVISGGYSIEIDNTSMFSFNVLSQKFDSLVSLYNRNTILDNILANDTKYLFAWGDKEPIFLMQEEHDSHHTEMFFNDTTKISCNYNFTGHTFPYCSAIDSFLSKKLSVLPVSFSILDTNTKNTITALVQNCRVANSRFDLFKNDVIYRSYDFFKGDTVIQLADSGIYYLKNISSIYGENSSCSDTIYFNKPVSIPVNLSIQYNNPVTKQLIVTTNISNKPRRYEMYDLNGNCKFRIESPDAQVELNMSHHTSGVYILKVTDAALSQFCKIIKL